MKTWTLLDIINSSRDYLAGKGFENARLETELLLSHAVSLSRIELYTNHERQLSEGELERYKTLLRRRLGGEPVQYITGTAAFMLKEFEVSPAVLIPRPETEALMEVVLRLIGDRRSDAFIAADVGTGSGVIAATLAERFPLCTVLATDVSSEALEVAGRNARRVGVDERVELLEGSLLAPLTGRSVEGTLAALISNPPYVPSGDIAGLQPEVRDFEPRTALDGGEDGLDCIRVIAQDGPSLLEPGGLLAVEFGDGQADAVRSLFVGRLDRVEIHKDYAGRDRFVTGVARP